MRPFLIPWFENLGIFVSPFRLASFSADLASWMVDALCTFVKSSITAFLFFGPAILALFLSWWAMQSWTDVSGNMSFIADPSTLAMKMSFNPRVFISSNTVIQKFALSLWFTSLQIPYPMKKMPEDFKMNILLPGTVWLLVLVLAGCIVVSWVETNVITVILFVVVILVVLVVPIAVYMEYQEQIEKWFSRHNRSNTPTVGIRRAATIVTNATVQQTVLPLDFPDALKGGKALALLDAFLASGRVSERGIPPMQGLQCHADGLHCRQHR